MKTKDLLEKAKEELKGEKEQAVVILLKNSLKRVEDCKKTLKQLEDKHEKLLEVDLEELELEEFEY